MFNLSLKKLQQPLLKGGLFGIYFIRLFKNNYTIPAPNKGARGFFKFNINNFIC